MDGMPWDMGIRLRSVYQFLHSEYHHGVKYANVNISDWLIHPKLLKHGSNRPLNVYKKDLEQRSYKLSRYHGRHGVQEGKLFVHILLS